MQCPIAVKSLSHPDVPATVSAAGDVLTFRQLEQQANRLMHNLRKSGVTRGARVGVLSGARPEIISLLSAVHRLGGSALMLNLQLLPADWEQQLAAAGASVLVGEQSLIDKLGSRPNSTLAWENLNLAAEFPPASPAETELQTDTEAVVIFTSSSTGHKKGVRLTLGNCFSSASASDGLTGLTFGDRWAVSLPVYHVAGLGVIYRTLLSGACSYFMPNFAVDTLYAAIETGGVTHVSAVPTVLEGLIEREAQSGAAVLKKLKAVILAGAASSEKLLEQIIEHRLPVLSAWGMTETTAHCTCMSLRDPIERVTGVGKPFHHTEVVAVDDEGRRVPPGTVGDLIVRGPTVCLGYLESASGSPLHDGWLHTGDLGVFDAEGYLTIAGRKDDMFISGGENIHPKEIEEAALTHPNTKNCAVVAIPHVKWGQRPVIFIEPKQGELFVETEVLDYLREKIAKIKVPDRAVQIAELPRTAIGKVDYKALKNSARELLRI